MQVGYNIYWKKYNYSIIQRKKKRASWKEKTVLSKNKNILANISNKSLDTYIENI